ncbi:ABC-type branched-chain amino acid transport systems, ATPase component [Thermus thermophilus]|nr:ABC-type branched-chain amino acid transport systems, ATPase component [Thermus thermophilus]
MYENVLAFARFGKRSPDPEREAEKALAAVGLENFAERPVEALNLAQLKRLELARALALKPHYLLVDEVFAGLNPREKDDLANRVSELVREEGFGLLLVEHDLKTVFKLSDWVFVLAFGEIIAQGPPEVVARDERVIAAYTGGGV